MSSPSVLLIRLDAIGDALALTPLLAAFREREIPVDLVMSPANATVFTKPAARDILIAPFAQRSGTPGNLRAIQNFGAALRTRSYSHTLVATEDPGGYRLAREVASPARIGFANGWGKPLKTLWVYAKLTRVLYRSAGLDRKTPHECAVLFELGRPLLAQAAPTRDLERLRPLVLERSVQRGTDVVFQVTGKWERLGMTLEETVAAFEALRSVYTIRPVCSVQERAFGERFARLSDADVEYFGALSPWKDAIASGRALVAPDSGAIHVAGMTGTPVVAVYGADTPFALQSARWAPWGAPSHALRGAPGWSSLVVPSLEALL